MEFVTPGLGLIFWQFVVFICLLLILKKFAWKPITAALHEREHSIDSALKAAEEAKREMSKLKADNEKLLEEARLERDSIVKLARQTADGLIEEAKDKATTESNRIVEAARLAIQQERQAAIQDIKQQVASLSLEIAEVVLRNQLKDDAAQRALVNKLVDDAKLN
ncbi:F0F1 ATP synthase subunit B [Cytophagaceae bacterium YF14B1]|uniref:ATP synthase subunit b n=1 Tax=Xanthocytophaga flava TaxID=3048013 RepID=A0AAE3UCA4_9BACT|nr:F0F1 ATP synthase subunit B [Xanthocytophaga flavus]MDJ1485283.1 F0F1 ATP synthase subunit B [Xanthocytophaga flavus]